MILDNATLTALEQAYQSAAPDMDEIAPLLPDLQGFLAGLACVAGTVPIERRPRLNATYHDVHRAVEVLLSVATAYHDVAKVMVGGYEEPLIEQEMQQQLSLLLLEAELTGMETTSNAVDLLALQQQLGGESEVPREQRE